MFKTKNVLLWILSEYQENILVCSFALFLILCLAENGSGKKAFVSQNFTIKLALQNAECKEQKNAHKTWANGIHWKHSVAERTGIQWRTDKTQAHKMTIKYFNQQIQARMTETSAVVRVRVVLYLCYGVDWFSSQTKGNTSAFYAVYRRCHSMNKTQHHLDILQTRPPANRTMMNQT